MAGRNDDSKTGFLKGVARFLHLGQSQASDAPAPRKRVKVSQARVSNPARDRLREGETELEQAMAAAAGPMLPVLLSDVQQSRRGNLRARWDTALTTADNKKHWEMADGLAPDAAANPNVRYILRNRARYEIGNNSYARGMVETMANDLIGTGPRLQVLTDDPVINAAIENAFASWCKAVGWAEKLLTMVKSKKGDGEAFCLLFNNENLDHPVKLGLLLKEADCVRFVDINLLLVPSVDGIQFDEYGNPVEYFVLRVHPGQWNYATGFIGLPWEYDRWDAKRVIHWFRADRPGQHRGLPEILPALPLFAQLRRFTLATLDAAEAAADHALTLETNASANIEPDAVEPMDVLELERRMMTTLPEGWHVGQVKPEHPTTTYTMFKREIITEIARCMNLPFNVAAGDSSGYNYASGRLDHQTYFRQIRIEQSQCETVVLDRIFSAWMELAILVSDLLPIQARTLKEIPHVWRWDGHEHVDPQKEAQAQALRLASNTTTLADECARKGQNWETVLRQRAKEKALEKELGIAQAPATAPGEPAPGEEDDTETPTPQRPGVPQADNRPAFPEEGEDL